MHRSFLPLLADPITKEALVLQAFETSGERVLEGRLVSSSNSYPIVGGIPRFAGYEDSGGYAKSFSYQWKRWPRVQFDSENVGRAMEGHTGQMWQRITGAGGDLSGAVIGDFGCGSGRFIETVRKRGGRVVALDLSDAVEAARDNFAHDAGVLICQADILRSPLRAECLDGAYSIGVLHHTPAPKAGLAEMVASVKGGGWTALSVYGKGGYYDFPTVQMWRRFFQRMWPVAGHRLPLAYAVLTTHVLRPISAVPGIGLALRGMFPSVGLKDKRWAVLDTFDSVTPGYQSAHEAREVFEWFRDVGLLAIEPGDWGFSAYRGVRPRAMARRA